ncbi:hypothetical protein [Idiomarina xiamenensis]|uniref:Uncharacterized protein n=1 Tax=Idiomarina xiamenensis 10-D-4 TaxID=740709 RepID=K2KJW3_9GAMM|nr:hypothetical protein [Idiomarina xiamenensis]EKE82889.1 hypothetical protein A10D4_08619 [Idiomarina xiamenensis 10-D-4]
MTQTENNSFLINRIKDLSEVPQNNKTKVFVNGFYGGFSGGGTFSFDSNCEKTMHNGGTIIAPEALTDWSGEQTDLLNFVLWNGSGNGCWIRSENNSIVESSIFGVISNPNIYQSEIIQHIYDSVTSGVLIKLPEGTVKVSGFNGLRDNIGFIGHGKGKTYLHIDHSDNSGIGFRFGKRILTDTRSDNLPVYDGTIDYFDENQFSPADNENPRIKNPTLKNLTVIMGGAGGTSYLDFMRVDGGQLDVEFEWQGSPVASNGLRCFFCSNLDIPNLIMPRNLNVTFSALWFWCYGFKGDCWVSKGAKTTGLEFKHVVAFNVKNAKYLGSNDTEATFGISIGYGSRNNYFGNLQSNFATIRFKASEEFDESCDLKINHLEIDNPFGTGLNITHFRSLFIDTYKIRAKTPLNFNFEDFYMFSSNSEIVEKRSSGEFSYDGNYYTKIVTGSITKYYERRPNPILRDAIFGVGELIFVGMAERAVFGNIAGGYQSTYALDSQGKWLTYSSPIRNAGFNESKRTSVTYSSTRPYSIENVDFGKMAIIGEQNSSVSQGAINITPLLVNCSGNINIRDRASSVGYMFFIFNSELEINLTNFPTSPGIPTFRNWAMVESKLSGSWACYGYPIELGQGPTSPFLDGYIGSVFSINFIYQSAPNSGPIIRTLLNKSRPDEQWPQAVGLKFSNCHSYAIDGANTGGSPIGGQNSAIISHGEGIPSSFSSTTGGWASANSFIDRTPFRRVFSSSSISTPPPQNPTTIGELAENIYPNSNKWWIANSLTSWSEL